VAKRHNRDSGKVQTLPCFYGSYLMLKFQTICLKLTQVIERKQNKGCTNRHWLNLMPQTPRDGTINMICVEMVRWYQRKLKG